METSQCLACCGYLDRLGGDVKAGKFPWFMADGERSPMNHKGVIERPGEGHFRPELLFWKPGAQRSIQLADEVRVWLVELDAGLTTEAAVEAAEPGPELALLSPDEQERGARFVRARDRRRFIHCRAAVREILGSILGQPPATVQFRAGGQGKPELDSAGSRGGRHEGPHQDGRPTIRFNISHSAELALVAVCRGRELGVDLERVRPIGEAERIVESYFSPREQAEFAAIGEEDKELTFLRGWTRKEAILKGLGIGLAGLAARYETGFSVTELTARFAPAAPLPQVEGWQLWEAAPRAGFVAALACQE
jgi:4'-phosphopantetheinyl transferase